MSTFIALVLTTFTAFAAESHPLTFSHVRAEASLAVEPPVTGYTQFRLQFLDGHGQPADPQARVRVKLFMKMGNHEHGSDPTQVQPVAGAVGQFTVTNVNFGMAGGWRVEVTLDRGGGNSETQSFSVVVR